MSGGELESPGITAELKSPERYIALLSPFGKSSDLLGDIPSYTVDDIDNFVFPQEADGTLEPEVKTLEMFGMLERVDGAETTAAYGPAYTPADEDSRADAYLSWKAIRDLYGGGPDRFLESPEAGLEELEEQLSFH